MIVAGAIEVELANSRDLSVCRWDTSPMRQHRINVEGDYSKGEQDNAF